MTREPLQSCALNAGAGCWFNSSPASLVLSVMATYDDEDGEMQWYPATIVAYRPNARIYFFTLHFDADGVEIFVGLPDETVELLPAGDPLSVPALLSH